MLYWCRICRRTNDGSYSKTLPNIQVNVVDINKERIERWNDNDFTNLPIYEPGLEEIIKNVEVKIYISQQKCPQKIKDADLIFISVNTPTKTKGIGAGQAIDLKYVEESSRQIAKHANKFTIVVEKSTLPVKTAQTIKEILNASTKNKQDQ